MNPPAAAEALVNYYRWHARLYDLTRWAFLFGRIELIRRAALGSQPRRVLEVGCGTGANLARLARLFPDAELVGVDLSGDMLRRARQKLAVHVPRVTLHEGAYVAPLSNGEPFDLIVLSYCLTMINPGFAQVLALCQRDLRATGTLAIVDFHDTRWAWFRRWMGLNHVRMEGQILAYLESSGLRLTRCSLTHAYFGLWRWLHCLATAAPPGHSGVRRL